jgi:UMP-CMP kinase
MQGRDDDNVETIRRRFEVFQESTLPVIQHYEKIGKLRRVI